MRDLVVLNTSVPLTADTVSVSIILAHETYLFFLCLELAKCFRSIKHTAVL